jgi:hypothetical protein
LTILSGPFSPFSVAWFKILIGPPTFCPLIVVSTRGTVFVGDNSFGISSMNSDLISTDSIASSSSSESAISTGSIEVERRFDSGTGESSS